MQKIQNNIVKWHTAKHILWNCLVAYKMSFTVCNIVDTNTHVVTLLVVNYNYLCMSHTSNSVHTNTDCTKHMHKKFDFYKRLI